MCSTCGCESDQSVKILLTGESNHGNHQHGSAHEEHHQDHAHPRRQVVSLETNVLLKNDLLAERNRGLLEAKNIFCVNLVSSPGSGKTTLLEKTINKLKSAVNIAVIEGDQQTTNDADRIDKTGAKVVQVNTGQGCHLDAEMVQRAIKKLQINQGSTLFIENVGNLVCPALFDLGEQERVVVVSVTEGEDKPLKYPTMFESANVCIINKIDLLPYVDFDVEKTKEYALRVNHHLKFFELSATTGEGLDAWCEWILKSQIVCAE
ncbi:MAG: hydrogenase nickel incorporation protein HypB [Cyclobacteriaceae bacterium]